MMPTATYNFREGYRYGFNGQEKDNEIKGAGNSYDFGARIYDPRLGRTLTIDRNSYKYPGMSTYTISYNNPMIFDDPEGTDGRLVTDFEKNTITLETTVFLYGKNASIETAERLTNDFKNLPNTKKIKDPVTGKIFTVKIDVKFVYDERLQNMVEGTSGYKETGSERGIVEEFTDEQKQSINFKPGDNVLEINTKLTDFDLNSTSSAGNTGQGDNEARVRDGSSSTVFHEVGHQLGFDERYKTLSFKNRTIGVTHEGFDDDFMSDGFYSKIEMHPIHFLNILEIAIKITNGTSGTTVVQTTYSTERKTVQDQEVKVHSKNVFKIDDTDGGDTESSTEEIKAAEESVVNDN